MISEIIACCNWWSQQLNTSLKNDDLAESFRRNMVEILVKKYYGHWYPENIRLGCGYRCVLFDALLDPVIRISAEKACIPTPEKHLNIVKHHIMYVNPGEVKIKNLLIDSDTSTLIFQRDPVESTPLISLLTSEELDKILVSTRPFPTHSSSS